MLYRRGNIWHVKFKAGGQTIQRSTRTPDKRKAEAFERALREQVRKEIEAGRTGKPIPRSYGEALLKWVEAGAPKSMMSHARNTRDLDNVPLGKVVPAAHAMRDDMIKDGLSPQTVNRRLAVVRRVLNVAYKEWDWLTEPLGMKIKLLNEKGLSRELYLSTEEVEALSAAIDNPEAYKVTMLAAYTGLRQGEVLRLRPDQWQPPYIVLDSKTKGKKGRAVPVIEDLQPLVTLPFKLTYHELRGSFERARKAIGREEVRFHDLRHTFASWLARNPTVPMAAIRDILGHSNLSVTSKYAHLRGDTFDMVTGALKSKKGRKSG